MPTFTFDVPPDDDYEDFRAKHRRQQAREDECRLREDSLRRAALEEEARIEATPKSSTVTFRIRNELLERLDKVADEAETSRGHLLRQIAADFLSYVSEEGILFQGSLISFKYQRKA